MTDTAGTHSTLRFERSLRHDRERVWAAVTEPAQLREWFPCAVRYEPRVGAPIVFDFGGEHGLHTSGGEVRVWDPPSVFAFSWDADLLRFELADTPAGGTLLVFTHEFDHEPGREARDSAGWSVCLDALLGHLGEDVGEPDDIQGYLRTYQDHYGPLTLDDGREIAIAGPLLEHDGRPAMAVTFDGREAVLLGRDPGLPLADGVAVLLRAGTVDAPGTVLADGRLRDPFVSNSAARI